ncbi:hypothetical protein [Roseofilum capinflatum]|uniref:Uncharacterized protein n=1 Tax=Roseofilum capinflatum BLCC-M114 TaxID=3022440 RepID=A0ABT7B6J7_9CYAN|nr:hypothetical protein [Roseofilum capinflatum]MDJ1174794.1 hypothetical protein [Roseofilum capinflatum BLCC-M114]
MTDDPTVGANNCSPLQLQQFLLLWCTVLKAQSHVPQPYSLFPIP